MSWKHIQAAAQVEAGLSTGARFVLVQLALHANKAGRAWPAAATLAALTSQHRSTVLVQLRQIVRSTAVTVVHRPGYAAVYDLSNLPGCARDARTSARVQPQKRARSPHRNSYYVTEQGDAAAARGAAAPPNGTKTGKTRSAPPGSVDYSRFPNWTHQRLEAETESNGQVIDLASIVKRMEEP